MTRDHLPQWYALAVRARQEKAAAAGLGRRGFETFLPTRTERHAWSDRIRCVELAMFPGYLFVRSAMSAAARVEMLKVAGVHDLVGRRPGDDAIAESIPDWQIRSLQLLAAAERETDPVERLVPGQRVQVGAGPLRGLQGVVQQSADGKRRLVVQVTLLGRGVRCLLQADDVVEVKSED